MRKHGTGTIETTRDGRFVPRLPGRNGQRLDPCGTREEAERLLAAALAQLARDPAEGGLSLGTWGEQVIDRRELEGQRAAKSYRSVWRAHVQTSSLGGLALVTVTRADVVAWVDELAKRRPQPGAGHGAHVAAARAKRLISPQTATNAINLVRVVLEDALERGLIRSNPAREVRLPTSIRKRARSHKTWTYLTPEEQTRLLTAEAIPLRERLMLAFALGTGGRLIELWHVRVSDVSLELGTVTFRKTKNGRPRTVALLPLAAQAVRCWLPLRAEEQVANAARARRANEVRPAEPWLWPTVRGCRRIGDPLHWQRWLQELGLTAEARRDGKHVRFHDLRHTCGTSLVQGWWGKAWSKEEVQVQLDHESITTTERYAHLDGGVTVRAAASLHLTAELTTLFQGPDENPSDSAAPPTRIELVTFGLGSGSPTEYPQALRALRGESQVRSAVELAEEVLRLVAAGDPRASSRAVELAEVVLSGRRKVRTAG